MLKKISEILIKKQVRYTISPENKLGLMESIEKLYAEDKELCVLALFTEIDEIFGNMEYRFENNFNFDDFDLEDIEDDGSKVNELRVFNTEKTMGIGKVFYKRKSIFNDFFKNADYPRSDDNKGRSLESLQHNLIVIPNRISQIKIKYLSLRCEYTIAQLKKNKNNLSIAMIPFVSELSYLDTYDEGHFFFIKGISDEKKSLEHLENLMESLNENKVNIVIFPEMVFTTNMEKWLEGYLKSNKTSFILIIAGSKWENKSNKCKIYNGNGIAISEQIKINPYRKTENTLALGNNEGIDIKSKDAEIKLLDIENLGRVSSPICVDFTIPDYFDCLINSGVNVSFNPVCTGSLHDFHLNAERLGSANRGIVFVSNSCMFKIKQEIGFVYLPIKLNDKIDVKSEELSFQRCNNSNNSQCMCLDKNCYFLIKFSDSYCRTKTIRI